jgi:hypothetical protein
MTEEKKPACTGKVETRALGVRLPAGTVRPRGKAFAEAIRDAIRRIAECGFNALVFNCFSEGICLFPSETNAVSRLMKQHPQFRRADTLSLIFEEAGAAGLILYAELDAMLIGRTDSPGGRFFLRRHPAWLMRNHELAPAPIGETRSSIGDDPRNVYLCPSNRDARRFLGDLLNDLAEQYPLSGIVLRFRHLPEETDSPDTAFCFCKACRQSIRDEINIDLDILEIDETSPAYKKWQEWSEKQFYEFLGYLRMRFNKARSGGPLLALMQRTALSDLKNSFYARALHRALTEKLIDAALLSGYDGEPELFRKELADDSSALGHEILFLPALPVAESQPAPTRAGSLAQLADITRQLPVPGFFCSETTLVGDPSPRPDLSADQRSCLTDQAGTAGPANASWRVAISQLPRLGEATLVAEVNPEAAVTQLSREIIDLVGTESSIGGFLRDMNTVLSRAESTPARTESNNADEPPSLTMQNIDGLVENLASIEQKVREGALDVTGDLDRIIRNLILIQRLLWLFHVSER